MQSVRPENKRPRDTRGAEDCPLNGDSSSDIVDLNLVKDRKGPFRWVTLHHSAMLQELVVQRMGVIEGHVQILGIGINTEWGRVMIGRDLKGRPVVLLLNVIRDKGLLLSVIGLYAWIKGIMPLLSGFYTKEGLDATRAPRIIVIAPGYSKAVVEGIKYLAFEVELYLYRAAEIEGELSIVLEDLRSQTLTHDVVGKSEASETP